MPTKVFHFIAVIIISSFLVGHSISASTTIDGVTITDDGQLKVDNVVLRVQHFSSNWDIRTQVASSLEVLQLQVDKNKLFHLQAMFQTQAPKPYRLNEVIKARLDGSLLVSYEMESNNVDESNGISLSANLPAYDFAGKVLKLDEESLKLPDTFSKPILTQKRVSQLIVPLDGKRLILKGDFTVFVQDNRSFHQEAFDLRVLFNSHDEFANASLDFELSVQDVSVTSVDLSGAANRKFRDDVASDGKGGWTDQGPENDLSMIQPGIQNVAGVKMNILDDKTSINTCIVLADANHPSLPVSVTVEKGYASSNYLYILHALAWAPAEKETIGEIKIKYENGSEQTIIVESDRDVGDWWAPYALENGVVAWTGESRRSFVGLFLSRFKIKSEPIRSITFASTRKAMWLITAASLSDQSINIRSATAPYYVLEGEEWMPIKHYIDIKPNSALDFSKLLDAPAGKHGRVICSGSHFAFQSKPEEVVRFYGNNLSFSANFLNKELCQEVVDNFARIGYNSVRFHHFDEDIKQIVNGQGTQLRPDVLDKLDYLFYRFKEKGIYITTDLYVSRAIEKDEFADYSGDDTHVLKAMLPISQSAMDNWKAFTKNLLTHVNPYTGMTWGEDPALFSISLINESTIYHTWQVYPDIKQRYLERFDSWLIDNNIRIKDDADRQEKLADFLAQLQIKAIQEMTDYVRSLGCTAVISDVNFKSPIAMSVVRNHLDYVDNHAYWDHPNFIGKMGGTPSAYHNQSAVKSWGATPTEIMASRQLDKPFTVTEFNFCLPNQYRAEGGPLIGALASLQDWSGLYRYAYSHRKSYVESVMPARGFDLVSDPISALSERMGIIYFLGQEIPPADETIAYIFDDTATTNLGKKGFPKKFLRLGLFAQIGSLHVDNLDTTDVDEYFSWKKIPKVPEVSIWRDENFDELSRNNISPDNKVTAVNGHIELNTEDGELHITTPTCEVITLNEDKLYNGSSFEMISKGRYNAVGLIALDNQSIPNANRILLLHLTNIYNTKTKFQTPRRKVVEQWGELPHLVEKGEAKLKIKCANTKGIEVYALELNGERKAKVPFEVVDNSIVLDLSTHNYGGTLAYEIAKN